jgi:tetratricopeptide (TPR) repeat protein
MSVCWLGGTSRYVVGAALVLVILGGCATPPPAPAPEPAAPPPVAAAPEPPKPVAPPPPPVPEPSTPQTRAHAQKLVLEAVEKLQNGDEPAARTILEQALTLDSANDLAKKLLDQIKADPQKELGAVFFRYTVQRDDSLSKLAAQYLGDRFRFHILAKYNEIPNPSRLAAGQVIKIPGRAQAAVATPAPPRPAAAPVADPEEAVKAAVLDSTTPRNAASSLMQQGGDRQKAGDLEGAYDAYREAVARDPANKEAMAQRDAVRVSLVRRYEREAAQSFQRQNLNDAITKWDRILVLDPNNQKAKLERERAIDLRKRMTEKFGAK